MNPEPTRPSWRTIALIVVGNLIPVVGVLAFGWNATQILILYWCENVVIGLMTLPRILTAQVVVRYPDRPGQIQLDNAIGKAFLGGFFVVHYGIFCLVHGVFAVLLVSGAMGGTADSLTGVWSQTFGESGFRWALLGIVLVHAVIFVREWVIGAGYRRSDPGTEMFRPYGRIIVMHLTVLLGAWGLAAVGAPAAAVLTLCLVKTVIEIGAAYPRKAKAGEASSDDDRHDYEV
ncbi:MAG: hypothetical protein EON89_11775 [Brevundimonas sp.]|nr:MAG: hypothetical protein EON89_11775 [Brevundimonas sp.]